jgi:hypothetical protein
MVTFENRLDELLLEGFEDMIPKLVRQLPSLPPAEAERQVRLIAEADPTRNKSYIIWLVKQVKLGHIRFPEDHDRVLNAMRTFEVAKKKPGFPGNKDVNKYDTFHDLEQAIDKLKGVDLTSKRQKIKEIKRLGANAIYDDGTWSIIEVTKPEAAAQYGYGTKWCTSNATTAAGYLKDGPLYIITKDDAKVAQLHIPTKQLKDTTDAQIQKPPTSLLRIIVDNVPITSAKDALSLVTLTGIRMPRFESMIAKDSKSAYEYATSLGERWPDGEPAILQDPNTAVAYAREVIKGRWPEAESTILKSAEDAVEYAIEIINKRWPEAESIIIKSPTAAHKYAGQFMGGKWPEAGDALAAYSFIKALKDQRWEKDKTKMAAAYQQLSPAAKESVDVDAAKDPFMALDYARYILNGRFERGEASIAMHPRVAVDYAKNVIRGRLPTQMEQNILAAEHGGDDIIVYAKDVIRKRWPEAEPRIMQTSWLAVRYAREVIKARWSEYEKKMIEASDVKSMYEYIRSVINDRWPEFEQLILRLDDSDVALKYAMEVIGGRWKEGESAIIKSPAAAREYAASVIGGRWPEGEEKIKQDAGSALAYALDVMQRQRWPEAEEAIKKDPEVAYQYARAVIEGPWPEGEDAIAKSPRTAYLYAKIVLQKKWPKGESTIADAANNDTTRDWYDKYVATFGELS